MRYNTWDYMFSSNIAHIEKPWIVTIFSTLENTTMELVKQYIKFESYQAIQPQGKRNLRTADKFMETEDGQIWCAQELKPYACKIVYKLVIEEIWSKRIDSATNEKAVYAFTAAISAKSCFDKSGAIFTSSGGGPASPHCISSRAAKTFNNSTTVCELHGWHENKCNQNLRNLHIYTFLMRSWSCFRPWSLRRPGVLGEDILITCNHFQQMPTLSIIGLWILLIF